MQEGEEKRFVVNSPGSLVLFGIFAKRLFLERKYITFTWRIGEDRSLDQNALFHVWCTEWAAFLLSKHKKTVTREELAGMKKIVKREFYLERGYSWLVMRPVNPRTQEQGQAEYSSSADWKLGEMFEVLTWVQLRAAHDGLILESKGQFNKLQREQIAA